MPENTQNRRDFLKTSGTAAMALAALAPTGRGAEESSADKPRIKKTLKFSMFDGPESIAEKFKILKDVGFDGAELDAPNDLDLKEVLAARDKSGLLINGLVLNSHWKRPLSDPDPKIRESTINDLKKALKQAKEYGATSVLLVPGVVNEKITYAQAYPRCQAEIKKAIPAAEETGVIIAIENVWNNFLLSPLEAARFIDELESPMVKQHFDIGNVVRYGWPEQWVAALGKRIFKLDTKGYSKKIEGERGPWKGFNVEIGAPDDSVNYIAVNKALRDVGYTNGWIAAEVKGGERKRMELIRQQLDKVLAL